MQLALFLAPPILALIYAVIEHYGIVDSLTGRKKALEGLERLRSTAGFPVSILYDDEKDREIFDEIKKRIIKRKNIVITHGSGSVVEPSAITISGQPIPLLGVPQNWPQEQRFTYAPEQPIMFLYGITRSQGNGKSERACSLIELTKWLEQEKDKRKSIIGAIALTLISIAFIVLRYSVFS